MKPHVLVTRDESTFDTSGGGRRLWTPKGKQPIRSRVKSKSIMVSDFLTAGGRLVVPLSVSDELAAEPKRGSRALGRLLP